MFVTMTIRVANHLTVLRALQGIVQYQITSISVSVVVMLMNLITYTITLLHTLFEKSGGVRIINVTMQIEGRFLYKNNDVAIVIIMALF